MAESNSIFPHPAPHYHKTAEKLRAELCSPRFGNGGYGMVILCQAVMLGDRNLICTILEKSSSIAIMSRNGGDSYQRTVVYQAPGVCSDAVIDFILGESVALVLRGTFGEWAPLVGNWCPILSWVVMVRSPTGLLELLLERGADIEARDYRQRTALHAAVSGRNPVAARTLLEAGAEEAVMDRARVMPLQLAFRMVKPDADNMCIWRRTDAQLFTECTDRKLSGVCMIWLLLENHRCRGFCDKKKRTILHLAVIYRHTVLVQDLLDCAKAQQADCEYEGIIDINARDKRWRTPLHLAAMYDSADIVQILLQAGASFTAKDKDGMVPLELTPLAGEAAAVLRLQMMQRGP